MFETQIYSDDASYFIDIDVPGFTRDDLEITVSNELLTVKGSCKLKRSEERTIDREFKLNETTDPDKIKAVVNNGILSIIIPRLAKQSSLEKRIEIK